MGNQLWLCVRTTASVFWAAWPSSSGHRGVIPALQMSWPIASIAEVLSPSDHHTDGSAQSPFAIPMSLWLRDNNCHHFSDGKTWGLGRKRDLPKVTQLVKGDVGTWTNIVHYVVRHRKQNNWEQSPRRQWFCKLNTERIFQKYIASERKSVGGETHGVNLDLSLFLDQEDLMWRLEFLWLGLVLYLW